MLNSKQKQSFAAEGYLVLPDLVPRALIAAARKEIANQVAHKPPPEGQVGPYFYFLTETQPDSLLALLFDSPALPAALSLIHPGQFEAPEHIQISLNLPPFDHIPGGPHIDGLNPPEESGRPGTFTMLAGILLTDQMEENMGNLWVWPGTHKRAASYFSEHGPQALVSSSPYPEVDLPAPCQVKGRAGDVLLAHYMLGHNIGGNTSGTVREVVYFRLRREGHREHWRAFVQNPFLEFEAVQAAIDQPV